MKFSNPLVLYSGLGAQRDPYVETIIASGTAGPAAGSIILGPFPAGNPTNGARSVRVVVNAKRTDAGVGSGSIPIAIQWLDTAPNYDTNPTTTAALGTPQVNTPVWAQQGMYTALFRTTPSAAAGKITAVGPAVIDAPVEGSAFLIYLNPYVVGGNTFSWAYSIITSNREVPYMQIRQPLPGGDPLSTMDTDTVWTYNSGALGAGSVNSIPIPVYNGLISVSFDCINGAGAGNNGYCFIAPETNLNGPIGPMAFSAAASVHYPMHGEQVKLPPEPCALQVKAPTAATITVNGTISFGPPF